MAVSRNFLKFEFAGVDVSARLYYNGFLARLKLKKKVCLTAITICKHAATPDQITLPNSLQRLGYPKGS
jgi:hypothetical protein